MYDVIVIGAGPAGANAALETNIHGLRTLLIDEQIDAGGQVWRKKSKSIISAPKTETSIQGDALRTALKNSNIEIKYETRVWQIEKDDDGNWILGIQNKSNDYQVRGKSLIIATGAQERIIPIPGWTLPGVFGLAGATALFKEHMMVPGKKTAVVGNGPLVFFVANEILRLGGTLSAVVTLNSRRDWLKALPAMYTKPALVLEGIKWVFNLYAKKVPVFWQHGLRRIIGKDKVEAIDVRKTNHSWHLRKTLDNFIETDSICYGHGLIPAIDATRLAGADHHYDVNLGGWVPTTDENGRTTVPYLYACGDNAGILGVFAAPHRGRLAALALLEDLRGPMDDALQNKKQIEQFAFEKVRKFATAMTALSIPRSGMFNFMTKDTEICRCEGITFQEIEQEIKDGALSPNAIKSGTRCGMGPCGGRFCAEAIAIMTEHYTGKSRAEIGLPTARPPLRPVSIENLSQELDYDALPIPGVSPL